MYGVSTFITLIDNRWHHDMYRVLTINCQPSSIGEINLCYQNYISTGNYETEANLLIVNCSMDIMIISGSECLHYAYAHTDSILNFPSWAGKTETRTPAGHVTLGQYPLVPVCVWTWGESWALVCPWCDAAASLSAIAGIHCTCYTVTCHKYHVT